MKRKKLKIMVLTVVIIILVVIIYWVTYESFFRPKTFIKENNNSIDTDVSLIIAGDALIHSSIYKDAQIGDNKYAFDYLFTNIKDMIQEQDLAFYNQETIIGGKELGLSSYPRFNTPEEFGETMMNTGFNLVSLANNHSLDKGEQAIINSVNYWKTKDALATGTFLSEEERVNNNIKVKNGISYTLLAYTTLTNGLKVPSGKNYLLNVYDKEKVKQDILRVRDKVDLLIVSMHWGVEYTNTPTTEQKEIATYLSSLGVDIVIGHHPHVIQPIEYINGTLVFYSLGNLVSAQTGVDKLTGMLCSLKINKKGTSEHSFINISDITVDLIYTYYKDWRHFKIIPFSDITTTYLPNYVNIYNKYNSIVTSLEKNVIVAKIPNN